MSRLFNTTQTENGARASATTGNPLVDFFATFGGMRLSPEKLIIETFNRSFLIDPKNTLKLLLYFHDIRDGQGERRIFITVMKHLIVTNADLAISLAKVIPLFGYWKSLNELLEFAFTLDNLVFFNEMSAFYAENLKKDAELDNTGLAFKYVFDTNYRKRNPKLFNAFFKIVKPILNIHSEKEYRHLVSFMRRLLNVVEVKMSANEWDKITFPSVPSVAHKNYRKAFSKHQPERYAAFIESVKSGKSKINAAVLTPVDVVKAYSDTVHLDETLEVQWKSLPNLVTKDVLCVSDVSGSMEGEPMAVSIALGIYLAQRCQGNYRNELITFDTNPKFIALKDGTLKDAIEKVRSMPWGGGTDIEKTFDLILGQAVKNKLSAEEMPGYLIVVTDMQFNGVCGTVTPMEQARRKFAKAGVQMPKLIWWNVRASVTNTSTFPEEDKNGVYHISGYSPNILKTVFSIVNGNTFDVIQKILDNERYSVVDGWF